MKATELIESSSEQENNDVHTELIEKIDRVKEFYVDWYIERLALDHYYDTGSKNLPPSTPFNLFQFIEFTVFVSDTISPFHKLPLKS